MSRIGKMHIDVPAGVEVSVSDANLVTVKGNKHTLTYQLPSMLAIEQEGNVLHVVVTDESADNAGALHGLARTLVHNMVTGVSKGFTKELEINGVGYRAAKDGNKLVLNVGYSHQVFVPETGELKIDVPAPNKIIVSGPDKQAVGQLAAEIRSIRPPEPYLGKGIKYVTEVIRRKEGKTAAKKK